MPISSKRGKAEKSKKAGSKSKTKPKVVTKKKVAAKKTVKKASPSKKTAPKKVAKKPVSKITVAKKAVPKKVTSTKVTGLKSAKTGKTVKVDTTKNKKISSSDKVVRKNSDNFELGVTLRTGRRPEAIISKKNLEKNTMGEEKLRYSEEELKEFQVLILEKLDKAKKELNSLKEMLSKKNDEGTDNTGGTMKLLEDGADTLEKENFSQLAVRQQKFVTQLENAVARIKNGTYGICVDTGKLIPKERLKAVPHTQHSIEAKLNRR